MAEGSDDPTIQILRDIQGKLVEHDRRFERMQQQIEHRFDGVERKLGEVIDATNEALGTAAVANVRHDSVQGHPVEVELELRDLRSRVRELEEKV